VVSRAYPGNKPDVTQFTAVIDELAARYQGLAGGAGQLTVVFDAGRDPAASQDHLAGLGLHFVASLPPSWHPELLAIPARRYRLVDEDRFRGLTAAETTATTLGADRRVIITHSPAFHPPVPRLRPDARQSRAAAHRAGGPAGPRADPPPRDQVEARSARSPPPAG
jgi:hypothetical protein